MSYRLSLDKEAVDDLGRLTKQVREHVARELRRLATNPSTVSYPAGFPHPPRGQLFDTACTIDGIEHFITVMFMYSSDEQQIVINWIMHRQRSESD